MSCPTRLDERREMLFRLEGIKAAWLRYLGGDRTAMDDLSAFGATSTPDDRGEVVTLQLPNGSARFRVFADPSCMDELISNARASYAPSGPGRVTGGYGSQHFKPRPEDQRAINWTAPAAPMVALVNEAGHQYPIVDHQPGPLATLLNRESELRTKMGAAGLTISEHRELLAILKVQEAEGCYGNPGSIIAEVRYETEIEALPDPMEAPGTLEAVAERIAHDVAEALSPVELAEVARMNATKRAKGKLGWTCHAGTLVDLVEIMEQAWVAVTGAPCNLEDSDSASMFDDAFTLARDSDYDARFVRKLAMTA